MKWQQLFCSSELCQSYRQYFLLPSVRVIWVHDPSPDEPTSNHRGWANDKMSLLLGLIDCLCLPWVCVCVCVYSVQLWFPEFYDILCVAPGAAAATVQLLLIWRLGGKFVASLLATFNSQIRLCGWLLSQSGPLGVLDVGIITRLFYFDFKLIVANLIPIEQ